MNRMMKFAAIAGFALVAACGGKGDDALGDNVADAYDNAADAVEMQADNLEAAGNEAGAEMLENRADALEDIGKAKEEAIDDADLNAAAVNQAAINAM